MTMRMEFEGMRTHVGVSMRENRAYQYVVGDFVTAKREFDGIYIFWYAGRREGQKRFSGMTKVTGTSRKIHGKEEKYSQEQTDRFVEFLRGMWDEPEGTEITYDPMEQEYEGDDYIE